MTRNRLTVTPVTCSEWRCRRSRRCRKMPADDRSQPPSTPRRPASCTSSDASVGERPVRRSRWPEVARWRKAERERLIAARLAIPADDRAAMTERIAEGTRRADRRPAGHIVSLYWPFRGEPDLQALDRLDHRAGRDGSPAGRRREGPAADLPRLSPGRPAGERRLEHPDPGRRRAEVDPGRRARAGGRLRSARTTGSAMAAASSTARWPRCPPSPCVIGLGYSSQAIATIYPQPHDIAMDRIVTET